MKKYDKEFEELIGLLEEVCAVPRAVDEATKARNFDVENEVHRKQLICNLSISYDRIYRMEKFIKEYNEKI